MKKNKQALLIIALLHIFSIQLLAQKAKAKNEQVKSSQVSYEKYIDDNNDAHLKEFMELVSIPSISSIPANKAHVEEPLHGL